MKKFLLTSLVLLYLSGFAQISEINMTTTGASKSTTPVFNKLVWSDEFNGVGPIDNSKWFHQTKLPMPGSWFNGEIQHYTDRIDNSSQYNGALRIFAKRERFTDQGHTKSYTSARLNSKFAFKYGRVEVRAKLPTGAGTWPAIWMLGKNIIEDGAYWDNQGYGTLYWPACGEIDIMEHWGNNQNYVQSALHTPSSHGATINHGGKYLSTASTDFHIYAVEWTRDYMQFSVDSVVHYTYNPTPKNPDTWPFNSEQYLLLNIAIEPSIHPSFTSTYMEVDYVRIYQESGVGIHEDFTENQISIYPNPAKDMVMIDLPFARGEEVLIEILSTAGVPMIVSTIRANTGTIEVGNLKSLPGGLYIIKCTSGTAQIQSLLMRE